jgi:antitoxin component YwqK of YwqJK toxin-antitoxin module
MRLANPIWSVVVACAAIVAGQTAKAQQSEPGTAEVQDVNKQPSSFEMLGRVPAAPVAEKSIEVAAAAPAPVRVEQVVERYPNGSVKVERHVIQDAKGNYVNHGPYTMNDPEGKPIKTGEFQNGRLIGKWTQTVGKDANGLLAGTDKDFAGPYTSEAMFDDGRLQGAWTIKDREGRNIAEWNFDRGIRSGKSTWWYSTGEKRLEANYKNGMLNGEVIEYERDGKVTSQLTYIDDRYLAKTTAWYAPGQKQYEGNHLRVQNMPEPEYDWWSNTSKPRPAAVTGPEQKHGQWTVWYRNGNKMSEGQYERGMLMGLCTWWYENGQKQAEGEYQNGLKAGTWISWHPNGLKETQGEYKDGRLVGKFMHWDIDGRVVEARDPSRPTEQARPPQQAQRSKSRR